MKNSGFCNALTGCTLLVASALEAAPDQRQRVTDSDVIRRLVDASLVYEEDGMR